MTRAQHKGLVAGNCLSPLPPIYPILTSKLKHPEACLGNKCERYNPYCTSQVLSHRQLLIWLSPHLDSCFKYSLSTVFSDWQCILFFITRFVPSITVALIHCQVM